MFCAVASNGSEKQLTQNTMKNILFKLARAASIGVAIASFTAVAALFVFPFTGSALSNADMLNGITSILALAMAGSFAAVVAVAADDRVS